ncbi:hypothetical protein [Catenulispora rubra]|uniref:hypothetical protein n=1 Tax=Catenulispora rubra TaxID=280293 RepID=UPI0018927803|nr:hypothetical protein [Catenulispora rubra]
MTPTIVAAWEAVAVASGIRWRWKVRQPARWIGLPTAAKAALAVYAVGFLEGAGSHVQDLAAGRGRGTAVACVTSARAVGSHAGHLLIPPHRWNSARPLSWPS